ncbi:MAG: NifU family protein [SAR86 cluster bacterium]|jgi:Fe/S biogenesis protein NfuA|nr:NifU family protein [SAR86 cluster bacterium]
MAGIEITNSAQDYLKELLNKQENTLGIKIFVAEAGTPKAETCIAYAKQDDDLEAFMTNDLDNLKVFIETQTLQYTEDAVVDYSSDRFGGTLTIKAPNAKIPQLNEDARMDEHINYILYSEINPSLASHGGEVSLVEILNEETAILQFGGGCQGCGMVDVTLKDGVEKTLLEKVPNLKSVLDVTDHSLKDNAYYK